MVHNTALHRPGEGEPGVGLGEVDGVHAGPELADFVRELRKAELDEDGEEEAVGLGGGAQGGEVTEDVRGAAANEELAEAEGGVGEERGGDVDGEGLVGGPGGLGEAVEDLDEGVQLGALELGGAHVRAPEFAVDVEGVQGRGGGLFAGGCLVAGGGGGGGRIGILGGGGGGCGGEGGAEEAGLRQWRKTGKGGILRGGTEP